MKVAVVGSRNLTNIELEQYISEEVEEIVSGGAVGVDGPLCRRICKKAQIKAYRVFAAI